MTFFDPSAQAFVKRIILKLPGRHASFDGAYADDRIEAHSIHSERDYISVEDARLTLERRRKYAAFRTLVLIVLVSISALLCLLVVAPNKNLAVVVTTHAISADHKITASDIRIEYVNDTTPAAGVAEETHSLLGTYACVNLPAGAMLQKSAVREAPPVPAHATVIAVPLESSTRELQVGQRISLASHDGTIAAEDVLIMSIPPASDGDGASSTVFVAVSAEKAQTVLRNAEQAPLLAIQTTR